MSFVRVRCPLKNKGAIQDDSEASFPLFFNSALNLTEFQIPSMNQRYLNKSFGLPGNTTFKVLQSDKCGKVSHSYQNANV